MRVAAIDCGTNSIRLLVADADEGGLVDLTRQMRVVRLGQDVDRTGRLADEALGRTFAATEEYAGLIRDLGVERVSFVATSASRDASNADVFMDGVEERLGVRPQIIPGTREAELSFLGATTGLGLQLPDPVLVVDIGGGSTEFARGRAGRLESSISMNMGSVRVTERFLKQGLRNEAVAFIRGLLAEADVTVDFQTVGALVGVAGTVTTVTANHLRLDKYRPDRIHGTQMSVEQVLASCRELEQATVADMEAMHFMHPGRRDVIAAGALIWSELVGAVDAAVRSSGRDLGRVVTSEHDILDGIALDLAR